MFECLNKIRTLPFFLLQAAPHAECPYSLNNFISIEPQKFESILSTPRHNAQFKANLEIINDRAKKLSEVWLRISIHSPKSSHTAYHTRIDDHEAKSLPPHFAKCGGNFSWTQFANYGHGNIQRVVRDFSFKRREWRTGEPTRVLLLIKSTQKKRGRVSPRTSKKLFLPVVQVVSNLNSNIPTNKSSSR